MGLNCFICGDLTRIHLHSAPKTQEVLNKWARKWAISLCSLLDLQLKCGDIFNGASFCANCQETVCNAEFVLNSITQLQLTRNSIQIKVKGLLQRNYKRIVAANLDECITNEESIQFILDRIKLEQQVATEEIKKEKQDDDGEFVLPNLPSRSCRLKKRKERQHLESEEAIRIRKVAKILEDTQTASWNRSEHEETQDPIEISDDVAIPLELLDLTCPEQMTEDEVRVEESCSRSILDPVLTEIKEEEQEVDFNSLEGSFLAEVQYGTFEHDDANSEGIPENSDADEGVEDEFDPDEQSEDLSEAQDSDITTKDSEVNTGSLIKRCYGKRTKVFSEAERQRQYSEHLTSKRVPSVQLICNHSDCLSKKLSWPRPRIFREHIESEHDGEGLDTPYHCAECPLRFPQYADLQNHVLVMHRGKKEPDKHICTGCGKSLCGVTNLRIHESGCAKLKGTGTPAPPIEIKNCIICGIRFNSPHEAQSHADLHVGRDLLDCVLCSCHGPFRTKTALKHHVTLHHKHNLRSSKKTRQLDNLRRAREALKMKKIQLWKKTRKQALAAKKRKTFTVVITPLPTMDFTCGICSSSFGSEGELDQHKELHQSQCGNMDVSSNNFKCVFCPTESNCSTANAQFPTASGLRSHLMETHQLSSEEADYIWHCKECDRRFKTWHNLLKHGKRYHGDEEKRRDSQHLCEDCGELFIEEWHLKRHIRKKHQVNPPDPIAPNCAHCGKSFKSFPIALEHEKLHSSQTPFDCVLCVCKLRTTRELQEHVLRAHEPKSFKCPTEGCGRAYLTRRELKYHHTTKHETVKKKLYKCPHCDLCPSSNSGLSSHIQAKHTRDSEKIRLKCRVEGCKWESTRKVAMEVHLKIVHKIGDLKIWTCRICGREFGNQNTLAIHEQNHGTARPHICEICAATFKIKKHLIQHGKVHASGKITKNNWKLQQPRKPRLATVQTTVLTQDPPPTYTNL